MTKSDSITKISPSLLKAQLEIGAAKKGSQNPFFHSTYADLGAVMEACKAQLNMNGITILQPVMGDVVETILLHESGEWISSETPITVLQTKTTKPTGEIVETISNPQSAGSAISYARRYGLQSMLFIPAEDDDAEKATDHKTETITPKSNFDKAAQEACVHMTWSIKESHSEANTGRKYKGCNICNKFLGWVDTAPKEMQEAMLKSPESQKDPTDDWVSN